MSAAAKKVLPVFLVLFFGYYLFTDPQGLADALTGAGTTGWDWLVEFFKALIAFFDQTGSGA